MGLLIITTRSKQKSDRQGQPDTAIALLLEVSTTILGKAMFRIHVWLSDRQSWVFDSIQADNEDRARAIAERLAVRHQGKPSYAWVYQEVVA